MIDSFRFGKRLRCARKMNGLTVKQLAARSNLSKNFISQLEQGLRQPSLENFILLSNLLNVSPDYLMCDSVDADTDLLKAELIGKIHALPDPAIAAAALKTLSSQIEHGGRQ